MLTLLGNTGPLLLAQSARQDSWSQRLVIDTVSLIDYTVAWSCRDLAEVVLFKQDGLWVPEENRPPRGFRKGKATAFTIVFMSAEDYEKLQTFKAYRTAETIFKFAALAAQAKGRFRSFLLDSLEDSLNNKLERGVMSPSTIAAAPLLGPASVQCTSMTR